MKQVIIHKGKAILREVPAPSVGSNNILVSVKKSSISSGTEIASVINSGQSLYKRAISQPKNVKKVLEMAKNEGLAKTYSRVRNKLNFGNSSGYSAAGEVIAVGSSVNEFSIGDKVACAGAGIANHAEVIDVPLNLAVKVPKNVSLDFASTVTLGAIAMQGVRRAQPTIGEIFVVIGLGFLGQLTCQILSANGCRVIGVDIDKSRIKTALNEGLFQGLNPNKEDYIGSIMRLTDGFGADGVIITAASSSNKIISDATKACRKKGRIVLVGDIGLNLERSDFYTKELDFFISTSYGPGRYDPEYEEQGKDYPLAYVRWTENRNMSSYLQLLESEKIKLNNLGFKSFPINEATKAFDLLKSFSNKPLMVLLSYPGIKIKSLPQKIFTGNKNNFKGKINIGLIGASSFAQGMHLPNIKILNKKYNLYAVMSRTGNSAHTISNQYKASFSTTKYEEILKDENVDLVFITNRHNLHCTMVLQALKAGKNVFVEKPLALNFKELKLIEEFYEKNPNGPIMMVGFNRRFSPAIMKIREFVKKTTTPIIINYNMNVGFISKENWLQGPEGGGRNIGEACHIYDIFNLLCNSNEIISIKTNSINPNSKQWLKNDNFVSSIKYQNGSICTLTYTSLGHKSYPKERMEIYYDEKVIIMDDYRSVTMYGEKQPRWSSKTIQKGHRQELEELADTLMKGTEWPISLRDQIQATKMSFEIESQIKK